MKKLAFLVWGLNCALIVLLWSLMQALLLALLVQGFGAWYKFSLSLSLYLSLSLSLSGFGAGCRILALALLPAWTGALVGPGSCHDHQGLRPCMHRSPLLEAGSHTGTPALPVSSLWDTMIQCSTAQRSWTATWRLRAVHPRS